MGIVGKVLMMRCERLTTGDSNQGVLAAEQESIQDIIVVTVIEVICVMMMCGHRIGTSIEGDAHEKMGQGGTCNHHPALDHVTRFSLSTSHLDHLGSVQQDVRSGILSTTVQRHDLAHGNDRHLVICIAYRVLSARCISESAARPGLTVKLPPVLFTWNPVLLGRLSGPPDVMTRIGRVSLVRDDGWQSVLVVSLASPIVGTARGLTTQLIHPGLVGALVDAAIHALSLDQILYLLPLPFAHCLFRYLVRLHLDGGVRGGSAIGRSGSRRTRTSVRCQSSADVVLALLALLGTIDPSLVDILQRQVDRADLFT